MIAEIHGKLNIVKYLIKIGFDKNWKNRDVFNSILMASEH